MLTCGFCPWGSTDMWPWGESDGRQFGGQLLPRSGV
jgi:hypothetical protein